MHSTACMRDLAARIAFEPQQVLLKSPCVGFCNRQTLTYRRCCIAAYSLLHSLRERMFDQCFVAAESLMLML